VPASTFYSRPGAMRQQPSDSCSLMQRPIRNHTQRGELIYDPFLGSGTTLAAAEQTGRICHGLELDPKYVDVVVERWQGLTGKRALLDGDGRAFEEVGQERLAANGVADGRNG
jgi:hypothetical protein